MSLRVRLVLLIVAMIVLVAVALAAVASETLINSLSTDVFDRSLLAGQQIHRFLVDHIEQHAYEYEAPVDIEGVKNIWIKIVSTDPDIPTMLETVLKLSPAIVEINVAGPDGKVLASSNPLRSGQPVPQLRSFGEWKNGPMLPRLRDLALSRPHDYQVTVPLGVKGESKPLFTIQVVDSTVLLRLGALEPQLEKLALVSALALLAALCITLLAINGMLRPLKRIETTIDRYVQGNFLGADSAGNSEEPKEFAIVEGKLSVLGERFKGAREQNVLLQHNLDEQIARMATELDVASRLAAISRLTGSVTHEIKNPLNAISLRLDLLRARLDTLHHEVPTDHLTGEVDVLSKEVARLDRVVKTFLDFSRPIEVRLQETDLASLAREVADLTAPQANLANITIHFDVSRGSTLIRGDADMLKQAILNLVLNAIEAMKNGGNVRLSVERDQNLVTLEVADDGPGIPADLRDKVFQLYFTTKQRGSGIGLAMTYRAVQLHNGTITFTSEQNRGTAFRLQFPALARSA